MASSRHAGSSSCSSASSASTRLTASPVRAAGVSLCTCGSATGGASSRRSHTATTWRSSRLLSAVSVLSANVASAAASDAVARVTAALGSTAMALTSRRSQLSAAETQWCQSGSVAWRSVRCRRASFQAIAGTSRSSF